VKFLSFVGQHPLLNPTGWTSIFSTRITSVLGCCLFLGFAFSCCDIDELCFLAFTLQREVHIPLPYFFFLLLITLRFGFVDWKSIGDYLVVILSNHWVLSAEFGFFGVKGLCIWVIVCKYWWTFSLFSWPLMCCWNQTECMRF